ncbi:glycosyltransferase family 1 protein [Robertmurraya sp. FSL R5-0851]|uniref:glycosyltransferase family 1 protein n=1 Tax=Robertmurraya sp. FSL R5-0851 TaxID=2921584 RepID=UPI0030F54892
MTIRVLHVIHGMGSGGAESLIMNIYRNIDRTKIQFDFLLRYEENMYLDEIKALGGKIYRMPPFPKHALKNYIETKKFFVNNKEYKIIHVHANALIYMSALIIAKNSGVPCRIMHSHSTKTGRKFYRIVHEINKLFIGNLATNYLACSGIAGEWMFKNKKYKVLKNAIETSKFIYNKNVREEIQTELKLEGKFVIGHVGRFLYTKNHEFIIDIFKEIYVQNNKAVLVLVGSGPLEQKIREKVIKLGLKDNVIFTGVRSDVYRLLQAFDIFVFPSHFEGLPVTLIEAQASGLRCFVSSEVSNEAKISELLEFIDLQKPAKYWANKILKYSAGYDREDMYKQIKTSGYDIKELTKNLEDFYLKQQNY